MAKNAVTKDNLDKLYKLAEALESLDDRMKSLESNYQDISKKIGSIDHGLTSSLQILEAETHLTLARPQSTMSSMLDRMPEEKPLIDVDRNHSSYDPFEETIPLISMLACI